MAARAISLRGQTCVTSISASPDAVALDATDIHSGSRSIPTLLFGIAGASERIQNSFGRERLVQDLGAKRLQRVVDRHPHRSHGADQPGFADALGAELG